MTVIATGFWGIRATLGFVCFRTTFGFVGFGGYFGYGGYGGIVGFLRLYEYSDTYDNNNKDIGKIIIILIKGV